MRAIAATATSIVCIMAVSLSPRAQDGRTLVDRAEQTLTPQTSPKSTFLADGRLTFPTSYREWIYLSSGMDMSYRKVSATGDSMFDNVFAEPGAYNTFVRTGAWLEGTMLVLEVRSAAAKGSINQSGKFQTGEALSVEVHTKNARRFAGGWGFFAFSGNEPAAQIPPTADCYSCHRDHGLVDTTFVQFYPTLLAIANKRAQ